MMMFLGEEKGELRFFPFEDEGKDRRGERGLGGKGTEYVHRIFDYSLFLSQGQLDRQEGLCVCLETESGSTAGA